MRIHDIAPLSTRVCLKIGYSIPSTGELIFIRITSWWCLYSNNSYDLGVLGGESLMCRATRAFSKTIPRASFCHVLAANWSTLPGILPVIRKYIDWRASVATGSSLQPGVFLSTLQLLEVAERFCHCGMTQPNTIVLSEHISTWNRIETGREIHIYIYI